MKYFFIDLENVRNEGLEGVMLLGEEDRVFIFYSDNAYTLSIPTYESINNSKAASKYIKTNYIGKNAMDFQIVSLFGAMIERQKSGEFYIVSHDNGFKSAVSFCESYFTEYSITVGVYPTILAAIKSSMKGTDKAAAKAKSADADKTQAKSKGTEADKAAAKAKSAEADKTAAKAKGAEADKTAAKAKNADAGQEPYAYIFEILKDILSEPTIALYAESIDAAVAASANRNELHANYLERCGSDEGEALFKVTQGDFEELKKRRPEKTEKAQPKPRRRRRRSGNSGAAQTQTSENGTPSAMAVTAAEEAVGNTAGEADKNAAEAESAVQESASTAKASEKNDKPDKSGRRYYQRRRRKPKTENGQKSDGGQKPED